MIKKYPRTVSCILWFGDKVALAQRKKTKTFGGYWEAAGGKVEKDEDVIDAARRETQEETTMYVPRDEIRLLDCINIDPTSDKHFVFTYSFEDYRFRDVKNLEKTKRSDWQLFTPKEASKLLLMPGIKENL